MRSAISPPFIAADEKDSDTHRIGPPARPVHSPAPSLVYPTTSTRTMATTRYANERYRVVSTLTRRELMRTPSSLDWVSVILAVSVESVFSKEAGEAESP